MRVCVFWEGAKRWWERAGVTWIICKKCRREIKALKQNIEL